MATSIFDSYLSPGLGGNLGFEPAVEPEEVLLDNDNPLLQVAARQGVRLKRRRSPLGGTKIAIPAADFVRLGGKAGNAQAAPQPAPITAPAAAEPPPAPAEPSILGQVGNAALSGLSVAGNILDLLPSMLRDAVTLDNPFDQLLTPFTAENRNTGRDVLTKLGITAPNNPDEWELADFAGFGVDLLSGLPMGGLNTGAKAASKAGMLLKNAGLWDDIAKVAPAAMGPRVARATTKIDDVLRPRAGEDVFHMPDLTRAAGTADNALHPPGDPFHMPDLTRQVSVPIVHGIRVPGDPFHMPDLTRAAGTADNATQAAAAAAVRPPLPDNPIGASWSIGRGRKLADAAEASGLNLADMPDDALTQLVNSPLGGLASWRTPFTKSDPTVYGTGERGLKASKWLDDAGRKVTEAKIPGTDVAPVLELQRLLRPSMVEATNRVARERVMPDIYKGRLEAGMEGQGRADDILGNFLENGGDLTQPGRQAERKTRRLFEGIDAPTPETEGIYTAVRRELDSMPDEAAEWGMKLTRHVPAKGDYFPRSITKLLRPKKGAKEGGRRLANVNDEFAMTRKPFAKDLAEGTDTIHQIVEDDDVIRAMLEDKATTKEQLSQVIATRHGDEIPPTFVEDGVTKDRRTALAGWLLQMPKEVRESGIYGNHPMHDLTQRVIGFRQASDTTKRIMTALADSKLMAEAAKVSDKPGEFTTLGKLLADLDMVGGDETAGALKKWYQLQGQASPTKEMIAAARKTKIPLDFAENIKHVDKAFNGPEPAGKLLKVIDSATNMFKAGVLTWPSRYTRDLVSGQFANVAARQWSMQAFKDADSLWKGKVPDFTSNPAVVAELRRAGKPATVENAADAMRRMMHKHRVTPIHETRYTEATGAVASGATLQDMVGEFPGGVLAGHGRPNTLRDATDALRGKGTTWNPLDVRGVNGRTDTDFAPAAAGNVIGNYIDHLNRATSFIHLTKKGVHPAEAAKRTLATQIDYGSQAHTNFSNQVMSRLFPFWRFTAGSVPYTLRQLYESPGDILAQTVRVTGGLSRNDATTPDYVSESASIPLGTRDDGTKSYLTGFGLMHEDPLSFLGGGVRGAGLEALSRSNPLVKAPLEWATGESFFQRGPEGGRDLAKMDPPIGRTVANLVGAKDPVTFPGSNALEFVIGNSPLSRAVSTARTITDTRKGPLSKLSNTLTGLRVTDVSPSAQDAVLRERVQHLMKEFGAKDFDRIYFSKEQLESMPPAQRTNAEELMGLIGDLAKKAKQRKAVKEMVKT